MALTEAEELELLTLEEEEYQAQNTSVPKIKTQGLFETSVGERSEILRKLRIPETSAEVMSRAMMDTIEPTTTSVPLNALIRTPQTLASIGAKNVASTVNPESMILSGGIKALRLLAKPINAFGRFVGKTAESTSGLGYKTPGVLAETVKNPGLLFGAGKTEARKLYQTTQNINQISPDLQRISQPRAFVRKALQFVDEGNLTPDEALEARKALDSLGDNVPDVFRKKTREVFDTIAKQKFAEADKAYAKAVKSEALRSFWGINKGGTPSIVKGGLSLGLPVLTPVLSPVVQGGIASGIGLARKAAIPLLKRPIISGMGLEAARRRIKVPALQDER